MRFHHYDSLRVFSRVAQYGSFSEAAEPLNLTKGAVSHQIRLLETALGFSLFHRQARGVQLTQKGEKLLNNCLMNFSSIDDTIAGLQNEQPSQLTLGITTYFASRWLSPKLMDFMQLHPDIRLRLLPMIDLSDLDGEGIDLAIRWGNSYRTDADTCLLFSSPAWPCGDESALAKIHALGPEKAFKQFTLLHDRQQSRAWRQWFSIAGISYPDRNDNLIIPDPNVRVEAVINGQGIALNDGLVEREQSEGRLFRLSTTELCDYGYYLVSATRAKENPISKLFSDWIIAAANG